MRLLTRSRYAVRAILDLAMNQDDKPVFIRQIAEREGLSERYLENLFLQLKRAGILESSKGRGGGFRLAKPPEEITILEIVEVVEGKISLVACVEDESVCENVDICAPHDLWKELAENIRDFLRNYTLKDLIELQREKLQRVLEK